MCVCVCGGGGGGQGREGRSRTTSAHPRTKHYLIHLQLFYQPILLLLVADNISLPTSTKANKKKKESKVKQINCEQRKAGLVYND